MIPQGRQSPEHPGYVAADVPYDCRQCIGWHATTYQFPDLEDGDFEAWNLMLLLQDVAAGKYGLDVVSRARAAQRLASTDWAEVIRGTCVVTGLDDAGVEPAPLGEPFWRWLGLVLVEAHDYGKTEAAEVIAACLGLEIDFGPDDSLPGLRGLEPR